MKENVYISFSKCTEIQAEKIRIMDVADVWCVDATILAQIKSQVIGKVDGAKDSALAFKVIDIIRILEQKLLHISVINIGDPEFLVVYKRKKKNCAIWQAMKIIFICLIVFCGGAFAIMAYGNDIDIGNLFRVITEFFVGSNEEKSKILELFYSVGLSVGIILFFNNWGKRKQPKDPTPIQVSMKSYEEELYKTIIENNIREGKDFDGN